MKTKEPSKKWALRGYSASKKRKTILLVKKMMTSVFLDSQCVMYVD